MLYSTVLPTVYSTELWRAGTSGASQGKHIQWGGTVTWKMKAADVILWHKKQSKVLNEKLLFAWVKYTTL